MVKELCEYRKMLRLHILENAISTLKPPNTYLKHPFVDPGSVYDGNLWDWDSYWAVVALFNLVEHKADYPGNAFLDKEKVLCHAQGNVLNFLDYQLDDGYIPMMVEKSDLPEPYLNLKHKEGVLLNMHKPFLCQQADLVSGFSGDYSWLEELFFKFEAYFACYDRYYYNENCGLYVWADDIMIGMDNDPASFGRPRFSTANIFLNSFMVKEMTAMSTISGKIGRTQEANSYISKAKTLTQNIQKECWDKRDQFFYSVDVDIKTRKFDWFHQGLGVFWRTLPIKIRTWSGFIPLWTGFATEEQAKALVELHLKDAATFNSLWGITSLAMDEKMFNLEATINPSNWLGPIWVVVNYIVFKGLLNYGYQKEARELRDKIILLLGKDLEKNGTLHEFYNPLNGEPVMNGGFMNWNMLVLNMLDELN